MSECNNINYSTFNFVSGLNQNFYINNSEENLKSFIDYGFLCIGSFINISGAVSGLYKNSYNKLKPVQDPAYAENTVWGTFKQPWVWESGISHAGRSPVNISGVFVNNIFYPGPTGISGVTYNLDYENGQVVFSKAVAPTTNVSMNYSYKWIKVLKASDNEGRRILQTLSYRNINSYNENNHNLQLPCIILETIPRDSTRPFELGSLVSYRNQDVLAHIYAESDAQIKNIIDILKLQEEKCLKLYDINVINQSGVYGLNKNGSKNPSGLNYAQIIDNEDLVWNKMYIKSVNFIDSQQNASSTLFWCILRLTTEIIY